MFNKDSPYRGQIATMITLAAPSLLFTFIFYGAISLWQGRFGVALNLASAKALGCLIGVLFHMCCFLMGAFKPHSDIVKERVKEFISDLSISPKLAFSWYWKDIKTNGIAYWLDISVVAANLLICIDGVRDFIAIRGYLF